MAVFCLIGKKGKSNTENRLKLKDQKSKTGRAKSKVIRDSGLVTGDGESQK